MGVGSITGAREVTRGAVHASHDGAGESAQRIAAVGAHAGREAQRTIAAGLGDAAKNIGDALKVAGDFAVAALWEKPIAEAEQEIRELDLKSRTEGWRDENGVERPGFELYRGAEAAGIGDRWEAYMAREAKKISDKHGLTEGQRQELSTRTRKLRVETKARLVKYGMSEAMDSNLRDIDLRAARDGEMNISGAVASAAHDKDMALKAAKHSGNAEDVEVILEAFDDEAVQLCSDNLVEKRDKLIRDKVIGGLGRKSEAVATAEADKIVRTEAENTVKALAAAGHYDRARKLVEQGKKLGYDDAALAKGRELVDGMEMNAAVNAANVAISAIRDADGNYPPGRVKTIDAAIETVRRVGKAQPKNSKLAADAAKTVSELDDAADKICFAELLVGMDNEDWFRQEGEDPEFPKGSREARLWPEAKKAWEKSTGVDFTTKKPRETKKAAFMVKAAEYASNNPAQFYLDVVQAERNGELKASDRRELFGFFNKGYVDGFADSYGVKRSPIRREKARAIAQVIEDEFKGDFVRFLATDKSGGLALGPDGLSFAKDAQPDEATWEGRMWTDTPTVFGSMKTPVNLKQSLPAKKMLELANEMICFSHVDGMKMDHDPVTGEEKEHTVNAVEDLKRYCKRVKGELKAGDIKGKTLGFLRGEAAASLSGTMLNRIRTARDTLLK